MAYWLIPFTPFEFLNRLYGFSLCPNDLLIFIGLHLFYSIKKNKHVSLNNGMMIGGAVVNALAFTGSIFIFSSLRSNDVEKERKRHDLHVVLEQLTKARDKYAEEHLKVIDYMNDRLKEEANAEKTFTDINEAMKSHNSQIFTFPVKKKN